MSKKTETTATKVAKKPVAKKETEKGNTIIKNPKYGKVVKVNTDFGTRIVNAMALYTNATVTVREKNRIALSIPLTIKMGKESEKMLWNVNFGPEDFGVSPKVVESIADFEIGKQMFAMLCDYLSSGIVNKKGKPFRSSKANSITTDYGDKYTWNGTEGIVTEATVKPKK